MSIEIVPTCPWGSDCETIKDNKVYRCQLYTEMKGKDASGEDQNSWKCAMAWMPILQTEVSGTNRQVAASVQSMRNAQVETGNKAISALNANTRVIGNE